MSDRPYNFSAGPAILPGEVFERCSAAIKQLNLPGDDSLESKLSILEISHRSKTYETIHDGAIELAHEVIGIPRTHKILLLQGGASLQFTMVPMNLRQQGKPCAYVDSGVWSQKAIKESQLLGPTQVLATSKATNYDRIPAFPSPEAYAEASYVHITTNNTIYGTEYPDIPKVSGDVPLVADMSSNIGARPMDLDRVALGYAGAQKNLGPSGVTLVFIREDLIAQKPVSPVPTMLSYATHAENNSLYNTINTFGVLVLHHVLEWVKGQGGAKAIGERNARKAAKIYDLLDASSLYEPHAQKGSRSTMNVCWTLTGKDEAEIEARTKKFLKAAEAQGMSGLKGHRSVGGCRASIYNAFPEEGVDALVQFMREFERTA
jgi:phosphoserine aminotransferase